MARALGLSFYIFFQLAAISPGIRKPNIAFTSMIAISYSGYLLAAVVDVVVVVGAVGSSSAVGSESLVVQPEAQAADPAASGIT